jgi:hypothetical protein
MKCCNFCGLSFDDSDFLKGRLKCSSCRQKYRKDKYLKAKEEIINLDDKKCSKCDNTYDSTHYKIGSKICNDCRNKERRDKRKETKEPSILDIIVPSDMKVCKYCNSVKSLVDFRANRLKCKKCENKARVEYEKYGRTTEVRAEDIKQEELDEFCLKLKAACRNRIRESLPRKYVEELSQKQRYNYVEQHIGCNMLFLKKWLQYNYDETMTDDNYGKIWFLDHVIPVSSFDFKKHLDKDKILCFNWTNLQPIGASKNSEKHNSIDKLNIRKHLEQLEKFCKENSSVLGTDYSQLCAKHLDAGNSLELHTTTS